MNPKVFHKSVFVFNLSPLDGSSQLHFSLDEYTFHQFSSPASTDTSVTLETVSSVTLWFAMVDKMMMINGCVTLHAGGQRKPLNPIPKSCSGGRKHVNTQQTHTVRHMCVCLRSES